MSRRWHVLCRIAALAAALSTGALAACGSSDDEPAATHAEFAYSGSAGPAAWGSLDPAWKLCARGRRQSPIDLTGARPATLPRLALAYEAARLKAENNGHSVEVAYPPGSTVEIGGDRYELHQFHYHAPSEHRVAGRSLPLEFHFVNVGEDGRIAVLGVLVEAGRHNDAFAGLARALPDREGETVDVPGAVDAASLLPRRPQTAPRWSYRGSLTTPPCSQGVSWHVFRQPIQLSPDQIAAYTSVYDHTNRPVQPLNGRELVSSR
jgi:carbonic anhydrase